MKMQLLAVMCLLIGILPADHGTPVAEVAAEGSVVVVRMMPLGGSVIMVR